MENPNYKIKRFRLSIDGIGCTERSLSTCTDFGMTLVHTLKLRPRCWQIYEIPDTTTTKPGVILSIIFLESSLVLHTWPEVQEASLDLVSCKPIPGEIIERAFKLFFKPEKMEISAN